MSRKRKAQSDSVEGLAEFSEEMARHTFTLACATESAARRRSLKFRAKQHARIATVLRELIAAADAAGVA